MLKDISLKSTYSSEYDDLLKDFYIPTLSESEIYSRAVGYFSSNILVISAQGLGQFIKNDGKMRLIIGDPLDEDEYLAVKKGIGIKSYLDKFELKIKGLLESELTELAKHRANLLSWMVAAGRLQIKVALCPNGLYHEKIGIMEDSSGSKLAFHGSANETAAAVLPDFNFESMAVYPSWKTEVFEDYGKPFEERFTRLWQGIAKNAVTAELPSTTYDLIASYYKETSPPSFEKEMKLSKMYAPVEHGSMPSIPDSLGGKPYELMSHQRVAIKAWQAHGFVGVMALATGAGKTITAIHASVKLAQSHIVKHKRNFLLIVSVPYQVLADQWCDVLKLFNIQAIKCYRNKALWYDQLIDGLSKITLYEDPAFLCLVVVNATLKSEAFQSQLKCISKNDLMFIGDECHHHGSSSVIGSLPNARYKIGLSATPWSHAESDKEEIIKSYYGPVVATYSIGRALKESVLCPYSYHPHLVTLDNDEFDSYVELTSDINKIISIKESGGSINEDDLTFLLLRRGRLLGSCESKFETLSNMLSKSKPSPFTLFYCGDGSTEGDGNTSYRDIERVSKILYENDWKCSRFTAKESHSERIRILDSFQKQMIDAVAAIRVLDEGFDIPACREAYLLASSRNERQFIQRRGRILRNHENKKSAKIHDFIVLPPFGATGSIVESLVTKELERGVEFSNFCSNSHEVGSLLEEIASKYGIDFEAVKYQVASKEVELG